MAKTIYKYPVSLEAGVDIVMPNGAKVLYFGNQHETPTLWAEVDPFKPSEVRRFWIVGTGHVTPENTKEAYVGTALFSGGALVWHLYEVLP